jgi:hypothetical protein
MYFGKSLDDGFSVDESVQKGSCGCKGLAMMTRCDIFSNMIGRALPKKNWCCNFQNTQETEFVLSFCIGAILVVGPNLKT